MSQFHKILLCILLLSTPITSVLADPPLTAGGDDVLIQDMVTTTSGAELVTMADGTLFSAVSQVEGVTPLLEYSLVIYRSTDGGTTWTLWDETTAPAGDSLELCKLYLAEGTVSRLYVLYFSDPDGPSHRLNVRWADPNAPVPSWTERTIVTDPVMPLRSADMDCDVDSFLSFYLYVVYARIDVDGGDIWFTRSSDFGNTWSAPYMVGSHFDLGGSHYIQPKVAYGLGGIVHVAWSLGDYCDGGSCSDNALRYRRAVDYASSGISDWEPVQALTSLANGEDNDVMALVASPTSSDVFLLYHTVGFVISPKLWYSTDAGVTWPVANRALLDPGDTLDMRSSHMTLNADRTKLWIAGRLDGGIDSCDNRSFVMESAVSSPLAFSDPVCYAEYFEGHQMSFPSIAAHPAQPDDYALAWNRIAVTCGGGLTWPWHFDATWRDDPGYPNLEPGFPHALAFEPASAPALVNLDASPDLEIVYTDAASQVQVLKSDGTSLAGWPQGIGWLQPGGMVAVGDLNNNGEMAVVVGEGKSVVRAWDSQGNPLPGFPVDLGTVGPTFVTIAPVAPPYAASIVACSDNTVRVLNYAGRTVSPVWTVSNPITHQAAVADLKFTGQPSIVVAAGENLVVINPADPVPVIDQSVTLYALSDAPVIADVDLDGVRDILLSTVNGYIHSYANDGSLNWSYDSGSGSFIGSVAVGHVLGGSDLEIAATNGYQMHLLRSGGASHGSYPQSVPAGFGSLSTVPIIDGVHWSSPDLVAITGLGQAWSFVNIGGIVPGWPKNLGDSQYRTPASGDIDLDGRNEIVLLSTNELTILDVNYPTEPTAASRYPMDAHDPGRSGCQDCTEQLVSVVTEEEHDPSAVTSCWFASPDPNPSYGRTMFSFAIPGPAGVQVEVYDLRGYRVRQVRRTEMNAGQHVVPFDGRDDSGRLLASGIYYARLSVRGSGVDRVLSRKFTVLK
ncbi:MAG: hypothetical protein GY838_00410 [bacterium]|nr:hypothetical protein [bacterium]